MEQSSKEVFLAIQRSIKEKNKQIDTLWKVVFSEKDSKAQDELLDSIYDLTNTVNDLRSQSLLFMR